MASLNSLFFKSIFRNRLFQDHDEDQANLCLMTKSHENNKEEFVRKKLMQSYPARAFDRRLQVDWARDPREGPRVLMSLRVDFEPMS